MLSCLRYVSVFDMFLSLLCWRHESVAGPNGIEFFRYTLREEKKQRHTWTWYWNQLRGRQSLISHWHGHKSVKTREHESQIQTASETQSLACLCKDIYEKWGSLCTRCGRSAGVVLSFVVKSRTIVSLWLRNSTAAGPAAASILRIPDAIPASDLIYNHIWSKYTKK